MVNEELVKSIASEVRKELFEGGPGSGNWGHKGRPGYRGGSAGGGGGKDKGAGISAHIVKPGVHASTFYDKSGDLKTSEYRKLTDIQKTAVLRHGVQKYKEAYVPKAQQGKLSVAELAANKKIGALEGMRRAALAGAKSAKSGSKEERASLHIAISLQQRASGLMGQLKAGGEKVAAGVRTGSAKTAGAMGAAAH